MNREFRTEQLEQELEQVNQTEEGFHLLDPIQDWDEILEAKKEYLKYDSNLFDSDYYGHHLLLERFFKKEAVDNDPNVYVRTSSFGEASKTKVVDRYNDLLSKGIEYLYGDGQTDGFMFEDGSISLRFGWIETDTYYDLIGFYSYAGK